MKTFNVLLFSFVVLLAACNNGQPENKVEATDPTTTADTTKNAAATTYTVATDRSVINWKGANKFTPKNHVGTIQLSEGTLSVVNGVVTGGKFIADMNSITSAGDEYTGGAEKVGNLIGHLKSADFFDVANHPTATFEITGVKAVEGQPSTTHEITGNFTLKGITKSITFPANCVFTGNELTSTATFTIDRSQWEVKYGSETFFMDLAKDKLINNNIELTINLVAVQAAA